MDLQNKVDGFRRFVAISDPEDLILRADLAEQKFWDRWKPGKAGIMGSGASNVHSMPITSSFREMG